MTTKPLNFYDFSFLFMSKSRSFFWGVDTVIPERISSAPSTSYTIGMPIGVQTAPRTIRLSLAIIPTYLSYRDSNAALATDKNYFLLKSEVGLNLRLLSWIQVGAFAAYSYVPDLKSSFGTPVVYGARLGIKGNIPDMFWYLLLAGGLGTAEAMKQSSKTGVDCTSSTFGDTTHTHCD